MNGNNLFTAPEKQTEVHFCNQSSLWTKNRSYTVVGSMNWTKEEKHNGHCSLQRAQEGFIMFFLNLKWQVAEETIAAQLKN